MLTTNTVKSTSTGIFLEKINLVSKFWTEKKDKERSLSEDDESIQTFRSQWYLPKVQTKVNKMTLKTGQTKKK